jgi:hypothetical protein
VQEVDGELTQLPFGDDKLDGVQERTKRSGLSSEDSRGVVKVHEGMNA